MRAHAAILGLAAVLAGLGPHALAGEDRAGTPEVVNTLEKLAAVPVDATSASVGIDGAELLVALAARGPGLESLVVDHRGSHHDSAVVTALTRFPALRCLTVKGDLFLSDADCDTLGSLVHLRELNLHLP